MISPLLTFLLDPFAALGWLFLLAALACGAVLPCLVAAAALTVSRSSLLSAVQRRLLALRSASPVSGVITAVMQPDASGQQAAVRLCTPCALPETMRLSFCEAVVPGQQVTLYVLPGADAPVVMTRADHAAACLAAERERDGLARKKRRSTVILFVLTALLLLLIGLIVFIWNVPKQPVNF